MPLRIAYPPKANQWCGAGGGVVGYGGGCGGGSNCSDGVGGSSWVIAY